MQEPARRSRLIRVDWRLRRCWLFGLRCHHGTAGCAAVAGGLLWRRRFVVLLGLLAMAHDWPDRRRWFRP